MPFKNFILGLLLLAIGMLSLSAQSQDSPRTLFDLISEHNEVAVYLILDPLSLRLAKDQDTAFQSEVLFIADGDTILSSKVKVAPRGNFRRKECSFPPLALNFPKSYLDELSLSKADHYKLVTHCNDPRDTSQIVCKEFMTYQLYELLTSKSFRTKWLTMHYVASNGEIQLSADAFLIESNAELRRRLGGDWIEDEKVQVDSVDAFQFELAALFQYMIGNRDMHLASQHNVRLLRNQGPRKYVPVPYDFDFSLFVKAPYAYPGLTNRSTVRRLYLGYQRNQRIMPRVFSRFRGVRTKIVDLIGSDGKLSDEEKRQLLEYINAFYDELLRNEYQMTYRLE
ncbi:MAG: hypothetical protein OEQ53_01760 [Saprospiraceae bacterium]|nr:hypothetical protein [Saprospiraceae bacterium]